MKNVKKSINLVDKTILDMFKKKTNYSFSEFSRVLGLSGNNKSKLKILLDKMVKNGIICYDERDNVYTLFENSDLIKGSIDVVDNRYFVLNGKEKVYINKEDLKNATFGDMVVLEYNFKQKKYVVKKILNFDDNSYIGEITIENGIYYVINEKNGKLETFDYEGLVDGHIVMFKKNSGKAVIDKIICHKNEANAEIMKIACKHGFNPIFGDKIEKELTDISFCLTNDRIVELLSGGKIKDLRDVNFITIDCDDTKDMDDAVSIKSLSNGDMVAIVAIALVPYYVSDGSCLADRVKKEGTSVYPPGCVIPMLPFKLSNDICSLNENVDRLTLCIELTFDKDGTYKNINPYLGIINSKKKAKYSEVNSILEDGKLIDGYMPFYKELLQLQKLCILLENDFKNNGLIEFEISELKLNVDDNYKLVGVSKNVSKTAEKIIEYLMLAANKNLTEYLSNLGLNLIYRVDSLPDPKKLSSTIQFLKDRDVIKIDNNKEYNQFDIQEIISELKNINDKNVREVYNKLLVRSLQKAYDSAYNVGHFPLGFDYYAQFTSPIRRGADWRNISIFLYYLGCGSVRKTNLKFSKEMLEKEARVYSEREREAMAVENEANDLVISNFVLENFDEFFSNSYVGFVSEITKKYLFITLENGITGKVPLESLGEKIMEVSKYYVKTFDNVYNIADKVIVKISGVSKKYNELYMEICNNKKNKKRSKIKNG